MEKKGIIIWIEEIETDNGGVIGKVFLTLLKWMLLLVAYIVFWIIGGFYILIKSIFYKNLTWIILGVQYCLASIGLVLIFNLAPESFWTYVFVGWMLVNLATLIVFKIKSDDLDLS